MGDAEDVVEAEVALAAFDLADVRPVQGGALGQLLLREAQAARGGRAHADRTHRWLVRAAACGRWARLHLNRPKTPNPETMYLRTMYPVAVRSGRAGEEVVIMGGGE